jgi:hypothetical protein
MGIGCGDVERDQRFRRVHSTELALPRGPHGKASAPAGRQLVKLVVGLLGEFEDVVGDGHSVLVIVKDGEKVVRVDAGGWGVGYEEGAVAVARWGKGVHVQVTLALVMWARGCRNRRKRKKKPPDDELTGSRRVGNYRAANLGRP